MWSFTKSVLFGVGLLLLLQPPSASVLNAQGLTGQITGSIRDSQDAAVVGAKITLTNSATGESRQYTADEQGSFIFTELLPGTYTLAVKADGFKSYEQKDIVLAVDERVMLRQITLEIGNLTETLSVTANAAQVETASGERSGLITTRQMQEVALKGRDYLGMMMLLPGVVDTAGRDAPGFNSLAGIDINGNRAGTIDLTLDGITNLDPGNDSGPFNSPSLDAVSEVKVLLTSYQAEYGRSSGGTIVVVTKNGTKDFHGDAYDFVRNTAFNANEFFNNKSGLTKTPYRYNDRGFTIGGPVLIPGILHRRDKLFFFWSAEDDPRIESATPTIGSGGVLVPAQIRKTFPTALERQGNFSQTVASSGGVIPIFDPLNNKAPFPGNIIPTSRINPAGQGLLDVFPLPNAVDPSHTYNYLFTNRVNHPWSEELLRLDWNISQSTMFYVRALRTPEAYHSAMDTNLGATNWPQFPTDYQLLGHSLVMTLIHTFSPTLVNEVTIGVNRGEQGIQPQNAAALAENSRAALGLNLPQLFPQNNPLDLIPNSTFGGVSNAPALAIEARFPYYGTADIWDYTDNLSKSVGPHNLKAGIFIENTSRNGPRTGTNFGQFVFTSDPNDPNDTDYAFSNALLGTATSYSESTARPYSHGRYQNYEFFIQDNWKAARRLTLDLGVRFYVLKPTYNGENGQLPNFDPNAYNLAQAPQLISPYKATPTSARVGLNPVNGQTLPAVLIGDFVPGTGSPYDGMVVANGSPQQTPPVQVTPRFGFAWDVFGNGKTAVRGGFGIFPDRYQDSFPLQLVQQPPLNYTYTAEYTTIPQLIGASLYLGPNSINAIQDNWKPQTAYSWNFGIQRDIGFGTVLDVAYVSSVGRHLLQERNLNVAPYGTDFLPSSQDPTNSGHPLPASFLRPRSTYGDILYYEFAANSNYNALEVQANKRFSRNLMFGASWTWSKAMDTSEGGTVNPLISPNITDYGKAAFDHTHDLVVNYVYSFPNVSKHWNNGFSKVALDGWQLSGITSFISGVPQGISYTFVVSQDILGTTGAGVESRVNLTGNPVLPKSQRTDYRAFNTSVVQAPSISNFGIGNAPKDVFRGPGTNNWNISLYKNFALGKNEARRMQFRAEAYNAFNHTQFNAVDTAAQFNAAGTQVNSDLGAYTGAAAARRLQLGLKIYF